MIEYERNIPYIVVIKDKYINEINNTTLENGKFCGYVENFYNGSFFFTLNGIEMTVIIPWNWIEFMAPSKVYFDKFRKESLN